MKDKKMNKEVMKAFKKLLKTEHSYNAIAEELNVAFPTIFRWIEKYNLVPYIIRHGSKKLKKKLYKGINCISDSQLHFYKTPEFPRCCVIQPVLIHHGKEYFIDEKNIWVATTPEEFIEYTEHWFNQGFTKAFLHYPHIGINVVNISKYDLEWWKEESYFRFGEFKPWIPKQRGRKKEKGGK